MPTFQQVSQPQSVSKRPYHTAVAVISQTKLATEVKSASFDVLEGWSQILTDRGIIFCSRDHIAESTICLNLEHPDTDYTFFEGDVVNSKEISPGVWQYHVIFKKLLSYEDMD